MQTSLEYKENLIRSSDGLVAECVDEASARRLAVCANALRGADLDLLETAVDIGVDDVSSGNMFSARLSLQRQRDVLLRELVCAVQIIKGEYPPDEWRDLGVHRMGAAIEAVTGPAQGESSVG